MEPFTRLIKLKRQEAQLKNDIKLAQESAVEYAIGLGKIGQVANIEGAKVTFKLVTIKPNTSMMKAIQEDIADIKAELEEQHAEEIAQLKRRLEELTTNEDILELEEKLAQEIAENEGEKKPQIAITLPK
jgi:hypothetical protein